MKDDAKKLRNLLVEILDKIPPKTGVMLSGGLDSALLACILLNKGIIGKQKAKNY